MSASTPFSRHTAAIDREQVACYVTHSNPTTHGLIAANLARSHGRASTEALALRKARSTGALGDLLMDHVKSNLKIGRVRADTFGYLQRSFAGLVSEVDAA